MDTVTLMQFEAGELSNTEVVEMLSDMLADGTIDDYPPKFSNMAKGFIRRGVLDEEGNINYIKLNEE